MTHSASTVSEEKAHCKMLRMSVVFLSFKTHLSSSNTSLFVILSLTSFVSSLHLSTGFNLFRAPEKPAYKKCSVRHLVLIGKERPLVRSEHLEQKEHKFHQHLLFPFNSSIRFNLRKSCRSSRSANLIHQSPLPHHVGTASNDQGQEKEGR